MKQYLRASYYVGLEESVSANGKANNGKRKNGSICLVRTGSLGRVSTDASLEVVISPASSRREHIDWD